MLLTRTPSGLGLQSHEARPFDSRPAQGPACSLAAAPATVHRNYFAEVHGQAGQTRDSQLNNLRDLLSHMKLPAETVELLGLKLCAAARATEPRMGRV